MNLYNTLARVGLQNSNFPVFEPFGLHILHPRKCTDYECLGGGSKGNNVFSLFLGPELFRSIISK